MPTVKLYWHADPHTREVRIDFAEVRWGRYIIIIDGTGVSYEERP